ncbi:deSI-like protein [Panicum miliaceum]|uniref:DeSI-like protein n=2 Tax=Paniceae TaxID=147428 RepID=A0A3L6PH16_PANMI|nr:deSI-like protein [Panicum miliaceum]
MRLESTETKNLADCRFSDDSHTTSNDNFDEDDLEDKHLLPTSSVGEDAIVKEVHR